MGLAWVLSACGPAVGEVDETPDPEATTTGEQSDPTSASAPGTSTDPQPQPGTTGDAPEMSTGPGGGTTSVSSTTFATTEADASTGAPSTTCEDACSDLPRGSCLGGQPPSCTTVCARKLAGQSPAVAEAFAMCAATEFLCFSTVDDCIWGTLYPEPVEQTYIHEGFDLDLHEGRAAYGQLDTNEATFEFEPSVIAGGELTLSVTAQLAMDRFYNQRTIRVFIDVDDDGQCTPGVDVGATSFFPLGEAFDDLVFVSQLGELTNADSICSTF